MVTKFEPNLGFEKSFISVLALKVGCSEESFEILTKSLSKSRADLQKMRTFYKLDFDADMDEEVLRCENRCNFKDQNIPIGYGRPALAVLRSVDFSFQDQNIAMWAHLILF